MNTTPNEQLHASKYIRDCVQFYHRMLRQGIRRARCSWRFPLLIFTLSLAWVTYRYVTFTTVYTGQQTYVYNCLHKKVYGEWIAALSELLQSRQYEVLAGQLQVPQAALHHLHSISATNIAGSPLNEDITEARLPFYVNFKYSRNGQVDQGSQLQVAFAAYLNHHPRAKMAMMKVIENRALRIKYLERQLSTLDSLKRNISPMTEMATGSLKELYDLSYTYYAELIELRSKSAAVSAVEIFDSKLPAPSTAKDWVFRRGLPLSTAILIITLLINVFIHWYKNPDLEKE